MITAKDQNTSASMICVLSPSEGTECWDACDTVNHPAGNTWTKTAVPAAPVEAMITAKDQNTGLQLLVAQIQNGNNLAVTCPKAKSFGLVPSGGNDWCPLGQVCGGKVKGKAGFGTAGGTKHAQKIPDGQGICVAESNGPFGRACWDICDYSKQPGDYSTI